MIYTYLTTLETSWPEVIWKVIDPNNETPDFLLPENEFSTLSFTLDEVIYPDNLRVQISGIHQSIIPYSMGIIYTI